VLTLKTWLMKKRDMTYMTVYNAARISLRGLLMGALLLGVTGAMDVLMAQTPSIGTPLWRVNAGSQPWFTDSGNLVRGAAFNPATGNLLVASRAGGIRIEKVNGQTGISSGSLNMTGVSGGLLPLNRIAVTSDGKIFATNLILDTGSDFSIYYWANEDAAPVKVFMGNPSPVARYGDGIGVSGSGDAVELYVSGTFTNRIAVFSMVEGTFNQTPRIIELPIDGANASVVHIPGTSQAWINGRDTNLRKIDLSTGAVLAVVAPEVVPLSYGDMDLIQANDRTYLLTGVPGTEDANFLLVDVTNDADVQVLAGTGNFALGENNFRVGAVSIDRENKVGYVLATNVVLAAFDLSTAMELTTSVEGISEVPSTMILHQNYPNPFNPATSITFELAQSESVELSVYTIMGQRVATLVNETRAAGAHTVSFDASGLSSGVYMYRLQAGSVVSTKRMTLMK
jgi:hypothetical protein